MLISSLLVFGLFWFFACSECKVKKTQFSSCTTNFCETSFSVYLEGLFSFGIRVKIGFNTRFETETSSFLVNSARTSSTNLRLENVVCSFQLFLEFVLAGLLDWFKTDTSSSLSVKTHVTRMAMVDQHLVDYLLNT